MEMLHSHTEMIDLNPLVEERHPIKPPRNATAEEYHCSWYSLTDRIQYLPGGILSKSVSYTVCFHDLVDGIQTHFYAPLGLNIKNKWTLCGSLPGEPAAPVEIGVGAPVSGLYIREDVSMSCNFIAISFVKKTLKRAHSVLVERLVAKAQFTSPVSCSVYSDCDGSRSDSEYEPIEFGRDGQITIQENAQQIIYNHPTPPNLLGLSSRPCSVFEESEKSKTLLGSDVISSSKSWTSSTRSNRAPSSYSLASPKNLWQNLDKQWRSSETVFIEPKYRSSYRDMKLSKNMRPQIPPGHKWAYDHKKYETHEPARFTMSPSKLCSVNEFGPVELEGSLRI